MDGWGTRINVPMCPCNVPAVRKRPLWRNEFAVSETETRKTESGQNNRRRCEGKRTKVASDCIPRTPGISKKKPVPPERTLAESGASRSHERSGRKTERGGRRLDAVHSTKMEAAPSDMRDWLGY